MALVARNRVRSRVRRWVLLLLGLTECLLLSGVVFGWPSLAHVLTTQRYFLPVHHNHTAPDTAAHLHAHPPAHPTTHPSTRPPTQHASHPPTHPPTHPRQRQQQQAADRTWETSNSTNGTREGLWPDYNDDDDDLEQQQQQQEQQQQQQEQERVLGWVFVTAAFVGNVASLPCGLLVDHAGNTVARSLAL
ncbi:activating signal cointegrator 1 complex subunit 2 homolog, partial [Lethenteron reissneri]|uniref:activating signal cointegrator 1 complex subunit 2 homolog n=1 Tax=Lethenteron reissneri TaxID=7753 RepID=UPI002AB71FA1